MLSEAKRHTTVYEPVQIYLSYSYKAYRRLVTPRATFFETEGIRGNMNNAGRNTERSRE